MKNEIYKEFKGYEFEFEGNEYTADFTAVAKETIDAGDYEHPPYHEIEITEISELILKRFDEDLEDVVLEKSRSVRDTAKEILMYSVSMD